MLDPGLSFLDDRIDTYRTPEVRPALEALRRHAERYALAVIMLCHFNKMQGADVLTKIAGSRAFAEVARAALAVAVDEPEQTDDEEQDQAAERTVILSQAKNNLGRSDLPNLTYVIREAVVETEDGDAPVGRLHWTGESKRTAEQALNGVRTGAGKQATPSGVVAVKILAFLTWASRPVRAKDIVGAIPEVAESTVRKELRRLLDRGVLDQPAFGSYVRAGALEAATSATSATLPAHTHIYIDDDEGGDATSGNPEVATVARVATVAGVADPVATATGDLWAGPLIEPADDAA
ncbi:BlaI/MecI/CopY family transcriptional regulator [Micromonospora chalcea]|uniref:BlaI/MecI/CopY family transcriptional regulator n=1 Tax=Micromonospora chalcea TaxID=1874 RepID=UPI0021A897BD|nr:BlaI/MecI/CopY family transcriptional regulator [Micromonospora chalcea]MCT2282372.1 BlaI/MecI/CopY family transcriptional regulator [Micromonospora chalcea]